MSKITFKSLLFVVLAIIPMTFFGQENNDTQKKAKTNYWFIDADAGGAFLAGDNGNLKFNRMKFNGHLGGGYAFAKCLTAYGKVGFGNLSATCPSFTTGMVSYVSYDLNVSIDLINLFKYKEFRTLAIKPHVGIGQMQFQARTGNAHYGYLGSWATEEGKGFGGRKIAMEVPMGLEIECNVSPRVALYFDLTTAYIDSDKLDAVPAGKHKDWVSTGNFGLRYKFRKVNKPAKPVAAAEPAVLDCESCKDAIQQAVKDAVEEALKDYQPAPAAVAPVQEEADDAEALEKYYEEKDIHLTFKVGKAVVEDTKANKDQVKEVSNEIEEGREIHTIKTIGYASPEGNEKQNQTLSENRAKATANYIQKELGDKAKGIQFDAKGMGSDWDGFFKALDESNIAKKAEIAETIKNADDQTAALNQMKAKYPELNNLLNSLRRTQVYINK